MQVYAKQPQL